MDILLTHAYFLESDETEARILKPYVPLGILSLAAYLEQQDISVDIFDTTFSSIARFEEYLATTSPPVVGIYVTMMTRGASIAMIKRAKRSGARVIVGGPEPPFYAEEFLLEGADIIVIGEGEITLLEVLRCNPSSGDALHQIRGIVFRSDDGTIVRTSSRKLITEIDLLPLPARHKVDFDPYMKLWKERHGYTSLSLISMRGCPYTCKWCSHAVYGESYRRRSPRVVAEEIESLISTYHPDAFWFADDVFTINHSWLFALQEEFHLRHIRIRYECITRADRLNQDVIRALKNTGCTRLWIGSESGSQRILDAMSRGVRVQQVREMTALAKRAGIEVGMFIMLGYSGETNDDVEATIQHLKNAMPHVVLTTVAYPIKGTSFYNEMNGALSIPTTPFSTWNDRMIDIHGRYPKRYYWWAHRRIVNETTVSRLRSEPSRQWIRITSAYLKAKIAHVGMRLSIS
jgi:anaerobic magnesium-protoporphyrin IX monomethyl ester cyclase